MMESGLRVPGGFCVTADAYEYFIEETGLRGRIAMELGRKRLEEMRWEEMWDAALRIRNMFLAAYMPDEVGRRHQKGCGRSVAVRGACGSALGVPRRGQRGDLIRGTPRVVPQCDAVKRKSSSTSGSCGHRSGLTRRFLTAGSSPWTPARAAWP